MGKTVKLTTETFIEKANEVHGNKYDYSKTKYVNSKTKVIIICPDHGEFEQRANNHLSGIGCKQCGLESNTKALTFSLEQFIEKARSIHGDKYDYSKVDYVNGKEKVVISCPIHGEFEQSPALHFKSGCPHCGREATTNAIRYTREQFINKAREVHGDKYDYSEVVYDNTRSRVTIICPKHGGFEQIAAHHIKGNNCLQCVHDAKKYAVDSFIERARSIHGDKYDYSKVELDCAEDKVRIICPEHGEFEQTAISHVSKRAYGCPQCGLRRESLRLTTEQFIERSREVHGDKYDYSKTEYKSFNQNVIIICKVHGEFQQRADHHLNGSGCTKCSNESSAELFSDTKESFISKAREIHGDKYDYSGVNYNRSNIKVSIICALHGTFMQTPSGHLQGCGCPKCSIIVSSGHQEIIDFIESVSDAELRINDRQTISPLELDIYIPEKKFAIEYHGLYWHSFNRQESCEERKRHQLKHQSCLDNGIRLFQIFEHEWQDQRIREILKSKIRLIFGSGDRIFARKCEVKELDNEEYKDFVDKFHLQGYRGASVKLGLIYDDELVCVMSFNKHPKFGWEITRFVSKLDLIVVGGASKLFKYFTINYNPDQVLTYADGRFSDGGLYEKLGFVLDGVTQPNYFYIKDGGIFSRQQFQKHKLAKRLETFNPDLTEVENMFRNGFRRMWDAGHFRFLWSKDK